jgi:hypothetical protein
MTRRAFLAAIVMALSVTRRAVADLRKFLVKFDLEGKKREEEVRASDSIDARKLIQNRYPKASITEVKEIKDK